MLDLRTAAPPLSVAQEALWYQSVRFPQEIIYNETVSVRHDGPLDVSALRQALEEIVARHEIWRTTFDAVDGNPVQIVHDPPAFDLAALDLSGLTPAQAEARAVDVIAEVSRVPYDVRRGPLLRPRLMRFPGEHQRLYLAIHHIIFDGVSIYRTVVPELVALYDAFAAGRPSPLEPAVMQYGEFARWEQQRMALPRTQRHLEWWRTQLADAPELTLPLDHPRPETPRFQGGVHAWEISAADTARLRELAQTCGATLFQALGAVWTLLLGRWSDQEDVLFGTAADLRQRPELESMVGYCLTPMVVRVSLAGDPTFAELIVRLRNAVLDGLDHLIPFERIVRTLHPENDPGVNPVYQTMLVLEPPAAGGDPRWSLHQMEAGVGDAVGSTRLDLELELDERPDGHLAGRLIFDRDLFDRTTVARLAAHLSRIVAIVAAEPELPVPQVLLLTPEQERRQAVEWNATTLADDHGPSTLAELIARRAARDPDAPALLAGEATASLGELHARAQEISQRLRADGVEAGDPVPVALEPGVELVATTLGALLTGARPQLRDPAEDGARSERAPFDDPGAVNLARALATAVGLGPADTAVVLPTMLYRSPEADLWPALAAGARVVLAAPEEAASGAALSRLVRTHRATFLHADPATWRMLVDSGLRASRTLRALSGPGALDRRLADAILARCRVLFHGHGTRGAGVFATLGHVRRDGPVTIGRPRANSRAYVLDTAGRPAPVGLPGELMLAGLGVAPGADEDPFAGGPAIRTGERARWLPDGRLELL